MEPIPVFISHDMSTRFHVTTALFGAIALPTLLSNIFLLFIVCRNNVFRDLSTMLVSFISFADVLYVMYTCAYIIMQYKHITLPDTAYTACITVQSILRIVPACTFFLIGYNWYLAAFKPTFCYKLHQTPHVTLKCFLATWLVSLVTNIGVPFVVGIRFHKMAFMVYSVIVIVLFYLFPLFIEIILHCNNLKKTKIDLQDHSKRAILLTYNQKISKVFLILSVFFFVFTAPLLMYPLLDILILKSSPFAVFSFHLISCLPCLMNPVCHCVISQKFQDELRVLFCMKKSNAGVDAKKTLEKDPINPEAFSANRGFFEPRTPPWRQGTEYWNRELIYGEFSSVVPTEKRKKRRPGMKDVRFSGVVEEIDEDSVSRLSHFAKRPKQVTPPIPESKTDEVQEPVVSIQRGDFIPDAIAQPSTNKPVVNRGASHLGTWPPRGSNPSERHNVASIRKEIQIRRQEQALSTGISNKVIERSKSCCVHGNGDQGRATCDGEAFKRVYKTKKRERQLHLNVHEEEAVIETYL